MIFVILGIAILVVSFVVAFVSLLREQKTLKENPKSVKEDELEVKEEKISIEKTQKREAIPGTISQKVIHHEESVTDDRLPWWELLKKSFPTEEEGQQVLENEEETTNFGHKLEGKVSIGDLVQKRKAQKDSASK